MLNIIIDAIVTGVTTAAVACGGFATDVSTVVVDTTTTAATCVADFTCETATAVADFTCETANVIYEYSPWGLMDQVNTLNKRLEELEKPD